MSGKWWLVITNRIQQVLGTAYVQRSPYGFGMGLAAYHGENQGKPMSKLNHQATWTELGGPCHSFLLPAVMASIRTSVNPCESCDGPWIGTEWHIIYPWILLAANKFLSEKHLSMCQHDPSIKQSWNVYNCKPWWVQYFDATIPRCSTPPSCWLFKPCQERTPRIQTMNFSERAVLRSLLLHAMRIGVWSSSISSD